LLAVLKKDVFLQPQTQAEFSEQREQKQTKFDYAESRTKMPIREAKRK